MLLFLLRKINKDIKTKEELEKLEKETFKNFLDKIKIKEIKKEMADPWQGISGELEWAIDWLFRQRQGIWEEISLYDIIKEIVSLEIKKHDKRIYDIKFNKYDLFCNNEKYNEILSLLKKLYKEWILSFVFDNFDNIEETENYYKIADEIYNKIELGGDYKYLLENVLKRNNIKALMNENSVIADNKILMFLKNRFSKCFLYDYDNNILTTWKNIDINDSSWKYLVMTLDVDYLD